MVKKAEGKNEEKEGGGGGVKDEKGQGLLKSHIPLGEVVSVNLGLIYVREYMLSF